VSLFEQLPSFFISILNRVLATNRYEKFHAIGFVAAVLPPDHVFRAAQ
jgi:hypothetical protein